MDRNSIWFKQAQLLVRVLPLISEQSCFALKGGTAINMFIRDLPRLSVDIDLTWLPIEDYETSLTGIDAALTALGRDIENGLGYRVEPGRLKEGAVNRLGVVDRGVRIKIEVSPVLRGSVHPPVVRAVVPQVEDQLGFAELRILEFNDLYAGKICAALDRQHPRDLFDVKLLLAHEGIDSGLKDTFIVYLLSHGRPMAELLSPNLQALESVFDDEFLGMTLQPITVPELEETRMQIVQSIDELLTLEDRNFLLSCKSGGPDWDALRYPHARQLPAVRWKLRNIESMSETDRKRTFERLASVVRVQHQKPD